MKIAFQMEEISALDMAKSTSFAMLAEAAKRGHGIFRYSPEDLCLNGQKLTAFGERLKFGNNGFESATSEALVLNDMDVVLMRQDPPFDMGYISATYLLEKLEGQVRVINNPREVRNNPEKIMPLLFPEFVPPTLIAGSEAEVRSFIDEHDDVIVKPLYAYGGRGVMRLKRGDGNIGAAVELLVGAYGRPFIAQKFIPEVSEGDKRILLLDGEVMGAFWRRPVEGDYRANLRVGGELLPAELTHRDKAMCEALAPVLREKGLSFIGIDVIGGYLTEINATSPMGFAQLQKLYGGNPAAQFWDWVEGQAK